MRIAARIGPRLRFWTQDEANPILSAPGWAVRGATCKDSHVMYHDGVYLVYCIVMDPKGFCSVALCLCYRGSYADEKTLEDGLYLAEIVWKGDQPLLRKAAEHA